MPGDSRRIYGPENTISPHLYRRAKSAARAVVDSNGKRANGRELGALRPCELRLGVQTKASGSAYFECGNTKILCSVYGPRDVTRRSEFSHKGQLLVDFKLAPYSCKVRQSYLPSNEEKTISSCLQQALESVVLMHKFPKARVDIFILVIENDGGAISGALTCAGAALANAGVEMYDLVVGCTLRQYGSCTLLDPDVDEEVLSTTDGINNGLVIMGMMPTYNQVILLTQDGEFEMAVVSKCLKLLIEKCRDLLSVVSYAIYRSVEHESGDKRNIADDSAIEEASET